MRRLAHPQTTTPILCFLLMLLIAAPTLAQDESAPSETPKAEENKGDDAQRKRLARLGAGKIVHPEPVGDLYTLDALLERSMEVHPLLIAQNYKRFYAELRQDEANWAMFPKFDLTSALTAVPANADPNEVQSNLDQYLELNIGPLTTHTLKIVFPIYTFGKVSTAQDLAKLGVDQADLEMRKERLKLMAQIREAYYSVQLGKMIQAIMADGVLVIKEEIARLDEARDFGDEDVDVVQLRKLQIYEAELDTKAIDTERLVGLTKAGLAVLVQFKADEFDIPRFDENIDPSKLPDLQTCLRLTRENRPDVELLEKAIAARKHQVDLATSKYYPDLFLGVELGYGYSTEVPPKSTGTTSQLNPATGEVVPGTEQSIELEPLFDPYNYNRFGFALGLKLSIDPVNQYWKLQQAKTQLAETRALREAALKGVDISVQKRWTETSDFLRKIEALERRLKAAERWRTQIAIAFQSGGASLEDFITPLKAYYEARLLLLEARYNYRVAAAKLSQEIGVEDIESIGVNLKPDDAKP